MDSFVVYLLFVPRPRSRWLVLRFSGQVCLFGRDSQVSGSSWVRLRSDAFEAILAVCDPRRVALWLQQSGGDP